MRLLSDTRQFLNVYCDLIISHLVNSEEETLLRVINNTARQDEKIMVTLDYLPSGVKKNTKPMYVRVIKKTFSSINVDIQKDFNEPKVVEVKEDKPIKAAKVSKASEEGEDVEEEPDTSAKEFIIVLHFRKA